MTIYLHVDKKTEGKLDIEYIFVRGFMLATS